MFDVFSDHDRDRDLPLRNSRSLGRAGRRTPLAPRTHGRSSLAIGVVTLALAACGDSSSGEGLARYYNQKLTFGSCEGYATTKADAAAFASATAECARLEVPLDYDNPRGRTAQVALLRVKAKGEGKPIGSLLVNPGGPGFTGMSHAVTVAKASAGSPVIEKFDLIGFDPRGVGASTPALDCFTDAEREAGVRSPR
jgi:alpha/beta hydrolase fold